MLRPRGEPLHLLLISTTRYSERYWSTRLRNQCISHRKQDLRVPERADMLMPLSKPSNCVPGPIPSLGTGSAVAVLLPVSKQDTRSALFHIIQFL